MKSTLLTLPFLLTLALATDANKPVTADSSSISEQELQIKCSTDENCVKSYNIQTEKCSFNEKDSDESAFLILECLCELSDDEYWNYLKDCILCPSPNLDESYVNNLKSTYCSDVENGFKSLSLDDDVYELYTDNLADTAQTDDNDVSVTTGSAGSRSASATSTLSAPSSTSDSDSDSESSSASQSTASRSSASESDASDADSTSADSANSASESESETSSSSNAAVKIALSSSVLGALALFFL
ncbi:uncharacterized protein ASCRUDRAFT_73808 [Ascoidea rubescens DSM 1968]|uniref:Uncharacterized protein n=1 Tax=Ascoidea rubescens DSM 1968 TaxID=1344418 RepID=A0A1D2VR84_9ASCO|nr:hypothetical protein ASCRUDRAFT_73808 [Ascoidea rubescens DSM 1968]ODV64110.1 hypothetical protein ASCRUDRAFT_73808 [Ascoidea rubescens DSM 1968]